MDREADGRTRTGDPFITSEEIPATAAIRSDKNRCSCRESLAHLEALYSSRGAPILRSDFADELRFDRVTFCSRRLLVAVTGHGSAAVYRLYTLHGLGYVGISDNWVGRIPQHGSKPWADEVIAAHVHNDLATQELEREARR